MLVEEWMTTPVVTVKLQDSALHARRIMAEKRFNQLPVTRDGRLVGIVTDRDVREAFPSVFAEAERRAGALSEQPAQDPSEISVESVMTPTVLTLAGSDQLEDAARLLRRNRIGAIPIVAGKRLVGIITRSDLIDAFVALAERFRGMVPRA